MQIELVVCITFVYIYSNAYVWFSSPSSNDLGLNPEGSAVNPTAFQQHIQRDSNLMAQLYQVLFCIVHEPLIDEYPSTKTEKVTLLIVFLLICQIVALNILLSICRAV